MRIATVLAALVLGGLAIAPSMGAADIVVGGKGPRVHPHGHAHARMKPFVRPVVVWFDDRDDFGPPRAAAPTIVIHVEGDVVIVPQEDGSVRIVVDDE
jgi:hypothetical protein